MGYNIVEKIISKHLVDKSQKLLPGEKIALKIDQTLTQDATGTMAYIEFESIKADKIKTKLSVSYVDHNTLQTGFENTDDHRFLKSFAAKYGIIFSPAGNGICHQLHLENFAVPGQTLLGSDSHTPTCGALGMLAVGAGGLDIACALAGRPFYLTMPEVVRINLEGSLKKGVSAKDVVLELLRRLTVKGGVNKIFEYSGKGLKDLNVYQRATISNMGTELGLTTSVFPSDDISKKFMLFHNRVNQWQEVLADKQAEYSGEITIELDKLQPMIACPHSPDNIKKVKEIEGLKINQVCIGSCTNSSFDDLILVAHLLKQHKIHPDVDLVISPGSRQVISLLEQTGILKWIIESGARILEPACGPCIGIGQVPATGSISLRTYNRNFKGRCGTDIADVYLCSPEIAIVSAIHGKITDPRKFKLPTKISPLKKAKYRTSFVYPPKEKKRKEISVLHGPNIKPLPEFQQLPETISGKVLLKLGDNISTDDILPGGAWVMSLRSNIPAISDYAFFRIDSTFVKRTKENRPGIIVAGENYGQGSSREHASIVLRYLGISAVIAKSFARIHLANLVNFGILPLSFNNPADYGIIEQNDDIKIENLHENLSSDTASGTAGQIFLNIVNRKKKIELQCSLNKNERQIILSGGLLNHIERTDKPITT